MARAPGCLSVPRHRNPELPRASALPPGGSRGITARNANMRRQQRSCSVSAWLSILLRHLEMDKSLTLLIQSPGCHLRSADAFMSSEDSPKASLCDQLYNVRSCPGGWRGGQAFHWGGGTMLTPKTSFLFCCLKYGCRAGLILKQTGF